MLTMRIVVACNLACTVSCAAAAMIDPSEFAWGWREGFDKLDAWSPMPSWLNNPSPTASVRREGGGAVFEVTEPKQGMKWRRSVGSISLDEAPYLVLAYRARNIRLDDDYLVHVDDGSARGSFGLKLNQLVCDGQPHTLVADMLAVARSRSITALAIQVQAADAGKAELWVEGLSFTAEPPGPAAPAAKPWVADLLNSKWIPHNDWLPNPSDQHNVTVGKDGPTFSVAVAARGMKWLWEFGKPVDLRPYRFITMRYTATDLFPSGDYALCLLGGGPLGNNYASVVNPSDIVCGGVQRLVAPLGEAVKTCPEIRGLALQVQALTSTATFQVHDIRFSFGRQTVPLSDVLPCYASEWRDGFEAAKLDSLLNCDAAPVLRRLYIRDWPQGDTISAWLAPFRLPTTPPQLASTTFAGRERLSFPCAAGARGVYLLLFGVYRGADEPVYGSGPLRTIRDVDRFRVQVAYEDGTVDDCLPYSFDAEEYEVRLGPQVLYVPFDKARRAKQVTICDDCGQVAFALAAATFRMTDGDVPVKSDPPACRLEHREPVQADAKPDISLNGDTLRLCNCFFDIQMDVSHAPRIVKLSNVARRDDPISSQAVPLCAVRLDGQHLPLSAWQPSMPARIGRDKWPTARLTYQLARDLTIEIDLAIQDSNELRMDAQVTNRSAKVPAQVAVDLPVVGPLAFGWYVFPCRGAILDRSWGQHRLRYGGDFPLQFMAAMNPSADSGVYLRTEDSAASLRREYWLSKDGSGVTMGVSYAEVPVEPGQTLNLVDTSIGISGGDWHEAFDAYRKWAGEWLRPTAAPPQQWFREVFNFRQRFLWSNDPLYDATTGKLDLQRAVDEGREKFGGIEYLHLFDWGNCGQLGRIYGRTGDHSPYDYVKGGREALHDAIQEIRKQGVPVGLYIEGYLLEERGRLGKQAKAWQLLGPRGERRYWPDCTEMFLCPAVKAWRELQASTYEAKVRELDVDGMYVDEFGFTGTDKDCYAPDHGHPVPSYPVVTERAMLQDIRKAVDATKRGVVIYTEETPPDVNTQWQDGSFTYAMQTIQRRGSRVPINLTRFAIPSHKTFEILYCDKPTGSWATGVKWTFFNGEGIWLEGPADEWFEPQTLTAIRKCHAILRAHKEAFSSDEPTPLVETLYPNVFANRFPAKREVVYTFYNSLPRMVREPVIRLPRQDGAMYFDAWNDRPAKLYPRDADVAVGLELGPYDVGCLVVTGPKP